VCENSLGNKNKNKNKIGQVGGSLILKSFGPIITLLVLVFTWMGVFESQLQQGQQTKNTR
jgi:hypothetical protein